MSERRACDLIGICRSTMRYRPKTSQTNRWLMTRLPELAALKPRYGYRRLHFMVLKERRRINHKRVYRVYTKLGLAVRRKKRKRVAQANRRPRIVPTQANEQWSMDFMSDVLSNGRRFRTLNIVDDATRECLTIEADTSLSGIRVARVLTEIGHIRPLPKQFVLDNGLEFTSRALDQWAYENDVERAFVRPGKPVENCFIESFNGKFRDECLNLHWFAGLDDARRKIEEWRFDYNYYRPHSSLGGIPPAEFAAQSGLRPATPSSVLIATPTGAHEEDQPC